MAGPGGPAPLAPSVRLSGGPSPRSPAAAAEDADATDAAAAAASRERAPAATGARGAGPSQRPPPGPRAGPKPFLPSAPPTLTFVTGPNWIQSLGMHRLVPMGLGVGKGRLALVSKFCSGWEDEAKDRDLTLVL